MGGFEGAFQALLSHALSGCGGQCLDVCTLCFCQLHGPKNLLQEHSDKLRGIAPNSTPYQKNELLHDTP